MKNNQLGATKINQTLMFATLLCVTLGCATFAYAALEDDPGVIEAPVSLSETNPTNDRQQTFYEQQGIHLEASLACSRGAAAAGETVNSYMIFFNSIYANVSDPDRIWNFDEEVLCIMTERSGLKQGATDTLLGHPDTDYTGIAQKGRGLETDGTDSITIDGTRVIVTMTDEGFGDWIRIVTRSTVPSDTTPPTINCEPFSENGNNKNSNGTMSYTLFGNDDVDENVELHITDSSTGEYLFGPFISDTTIRHIVAPGTAPDMQPRTNGTFDFTVKTPGNISLSATDAAGNESSVDCR